VSDVQCRIAALLERRRTQLPLVLREVERWKQLEHEISALHDAVDELRAHVHTPIEVRHALSGFETDELRKDIPAALRQLEVLQARFSRSTINIGVSGRARVGKSTLLQSISGLGDEQIPTGRGLPVTAVQSRIFHSKLHNRATLTLHTFETFREELLRPYHKALGLLTPPASPAEFEAWKYPASEADLGPTHADKHSSVTTLRRLKSMQESLWSYVDDLHGGERTVELSALRQFVAYPTNEQVDSARCPRRYLAVRSVRLECPFPHEQVDHLGIIDLPGLGELAANAEEYHLAGLQNEVDVVLFVKRPVEGMAYWGQEDGATANLLDRARGFIKNRRDYVFIALNSGDADAELTTALRDDIRRQVNDDIDGKHFQVLEGDVASQKSVYKSILTPVLEHLATRLPVMDREVFEGTRAAHAALTARIEGMLRELDTALRAPGRRPRNTREDLESRGSELRQDLAAALEEFIGNLHAQARSGEEDPRFIAALENAYEGVHAWIEEGFGLGQQTWLTQALRQMRADRNSAPFAAREFNRIRIEISQRYRSIDDYFQACVAELWGTMGQIAKRCLGDLLASADDENALAVLAHHLSEAVEPCPTLSQAVHDILALRLEYRTQLHSRVRRELDDLNLELYDHELGEPRAQIVVPANSLGAERLYRYLSQRAEQAAYGVKKTLMLEALTPSLVLHAAAEQFEDTLIRSGNSEVEFRRLAHSFRDEIWPNVFQDIDEANARFDAVDRSIRGVRKLLGSFERGLVQA